MFRRIGMAVAATGGTAALLNHERVRDSGFVRFGRAAIVIGDIVIDYKAVFKDLRDISHSQKIYAEKISQVHTRSAEKLLKLCFKNGGCFVKVGQHLAALAYLLPIEYINTLKILHDNAPQTKLEDIYKVIEEDLGRTVKELFSSFDPEPLGTASLAQVHKATLFDGKVVAVKVQHPKVKAHSYIDLKTMEILVKLVARIFPKFQFVWLAEESKKNLPKELDFVNEGLNCERVSKMLQRFKNLKVPRIYWDLSTERVLTMEHCSGGKVNDRSYMLQNNIAVDQVSKELGKLYSEMIFVNGFVHCDPHPGNVLVNKDDKGEMQIVLLDHGLYQQLTDDFRINYCNLWMSIINADIQGIKSCAELMKCGHVFSLFACMVTGRSWSAVTGGVGNVKFTEDENEEIKFNAGSYLPEIADVLNKVPRQMLLLFKTNDLLRGIECTLRTRASASSFINMSRSCVRSLATNRRRNSTSMLTKFRVTVSEGWILLNIDIYVLYLWLKQIANIGFLLGR